MNSGDISQSKSQLKNARLPSLMALRCFEAAARLENFTNAGRELHLTHGAISRAVRVLEDDLGVALFERRSRHVFLTEAGRKLAHAVHDGLALMQQSVRDIRTSARKSRHCVLSCEPTLLMRWLIPRWPDFQTRRPDANILLVAGGGPFSFGDGIDLAIRRNDFDWPEATYAEKLFSEKVGPVCRPDKVSEWFSRKNGVTNLRLLAPRLTTRTRPNAWQEWSSIVGQPLQEAPDLVFEHFYFSLQAAVAGLGIAIGPWHLVRDDLDGGVLTAPMGFLEDGSHYCLLSPSPSVEGSLQGDLLTWIKSLA